MQMPIERDAMKGEDSECSKSNSLQNVFMPVLLPQDCRVRYKTRDGESNGQVGRNGIER